jgi:hypothetical protein
LLYWLIPLIAVILIGGGLGAYFAFWYGAAHDIIESVFAQTEGEILLEPSGVAGPDSFAGEQFLPIGPSTTLKIPSPAITLPPVTTTTLAQATTTAGAQPVVVATYTGDTPALYGGSKSKLISDKEGELRFLEQNPLKAAAFCEALNSDPTLRWSGGSTVQPYQLRDYFAELTPMLLTRDTRVTNYGYRDGRPTPRQSVLQAGQLVLVDRYGVPRKRSECGNPLTPPIPSRRPPIYTGPQWPGFNPTTIIVIQQTTVIIDIFVVIDINTGQPYGRPWGSDGNRDTERPGRDGTTTTSTSTTGFTTTTTSGPVGPVAPGELNGTWIGTFTITDLALDPAAVQEAEQQGCSLEFLEALEGQPLPLTMEITVDASGAGGYAVMTLDVSSLDPSGGTTNEPQTIDFSIDGNNLTFYFPSDSGAPTTMTGTVSRRGSDLVISGTMVSGDQTSSITASWELGKVGAL